MNVKKILTACIVTYAGCRALKQYTKAVYTIGRVKGHIDFASTMINKQCEAEDEEE